LEQRHSAFREKTINENKTMNKTNKPVPSLAHHPLQQAIALALTLGTAGAQAANISVNSAADAALPANDGNCTLREAIQAANTNIAVDSCPAGTSEPDTIQFNAGLGTITLTSGQIDITETLSITGPAAGQTISGGGNSRILAVTTVGTGLNLENLTLTGGAVSTAYYGYYLSTCANGSRAGAAVCSPGDVVLTNSTLSDNSISGFNSAGAGFMPVVL
jgi:CSLREA domain-containing protein